MRFVKQRYAGALLAVIAAFGLAGCDVAPQEQEAPAPPQVSVLTLTGRELVISEDLPARVAALRSADIRAQISGIVQRRLFEGRRDQRRHSAVPDKPGPLQGRCRQRRRRIATGRGRAGPRPHPD